MPPAPGHVEIYGPLNVHTKSCKNMLVMSETVFQVWILVKQLLRSDQCQITDIEINFNLSFLDEFLSQRFLDHLCHLACQNMLKSSAVSELE